MQNNTMQNANMKQAAHQLVDNLSDNATWDDLVYELAVRREIEKGLADSDAGRTIPLEDMLKEFGLPE